MKKTISLLLALLLCLSLCACGGGDETANKETPSDTQNPAPTTAPTEENSEEISTEEPIMVTGDLLENAVLIDAYEFFNEVNDNIVRAEIEYDGKPVLFRDKIIEIQKDYIVVGEANTRIKVYLETEDIITVNNGQYILVAGVISNIALGQEFSLPYVSMDMQQGYLVQNHETDDEPLYKNAKNLIAEENYVDAIFILRGLEGYSDSNDLLLEAACKAEFNGVDGNKSWKAIFEGLNSTPLTGAEIEEIIVGDWYSGADVFSTYSKNGEFYHRGNTDSGFVWFVENDRLVRESEYTRSEIVIFPFYKNAYVFCSPRAYNKVTDDVYELHFLNGPVE